MSLQRGFNYRTVGTVGRASDRQEVCLCLGETAGRRLWASARLARSWRALEAGPGAVLAQLVLCWAHAVSSLGILARLPVASPSLGWGFDLVSSHPQRKDGLREVERVAHQLS